MNSVIEYVSLYPALAFDFTATMRQQPRIYCTETLQLYAEELLPSFEYHPGGRGRPNRNQTRAHAQCKSCQRVLRNDFFFTPPSMRAKNVLYSHCKTCAHDAKSTSLPPSEAAGAHSHCRRTPLWAYLAPSCSHCGFDDHYSAMDLHHPDNGVEALVDQIAEEFIRKRDIYRAEQLLRESKRCLPLCSNCHRMVHGADLIPVATNGLSYNLGKLLDHLNELSPEESDR